MAFSTATAGSGTGEGGSASGGTAGAAAAGAAAGELRAAAAVFQKSAGVWPSWVQQASQAAEPGAQRLTSSSTAWRAAAGSGSRAARWRGVSPRGPASHTGVSHKDELPYGVKCSRRGEARGEAVLVW